MNNNERAPRTEQFVSYLKQKDQEYKEAVAHGDPIAAEKAKEEIKEFLTEEQDLSITNLDLFSEDVQNLILEAEDENYKLHSKEDYSQMN